MSRRRPKPVEGRQGKATVVRGPDKDGRWYWRAMWWVEDESGERVRRTKSLGWLRSRSEAREMLLALESTGATRPNAPAVVRNVGGVLDRWLAAQEARSDLATSTKANYRRAVRRLKTGGLGEILVTQVSEADLEDYRDRAGATSTCKVDLSYMATAWKWARKRGGVPQRDLGMPSVRVKTRKYNHRTPTPVEVESALGHLTTPWHEVALRLLWATGCRVGEIASLTWDRVDLARASVQVEGKTGTREVILPPHAVVLLRQWQEQGEDSPLVLGAVKPRNVGRLLRVALTRCCAEAEVERFTCHGLRRLAVDTLARSGVDVATAAAHLGHTPEVMLAMYRQVSEEDRRAAVARAGLGAVPEGRIYKFPGTVKKASGA